jgi:uncharacterized membrane protein
MDAAVVAEVRVWRRDALSEYVRGSLWVLPTASVILALAAGTGLSLVKLGPGSPLAFQGTADDARNLLAAVASTMVTVIALLLGLTVVALQLASTQFSPRLLRNFLRDRPNQLVLSAFAATFAYSAAGLYTVGVSGGNRSAEFPRLAVTGALVLLFICLGLLVFFADHLAHSIQIDAIMGVVLRDTITVINTRMLAGGGRAPPVPEDAAVVPAQQSGYVQTVDPQRLLEAARQHRIWLRLRPRVGEHVVAGTPIGWIWSAVTGQPPDPSVLQPSVADAIRIGFERTLEQDPAFGLRQLVDVACRALSPAVNDPYSAIQAVDRLSVIFCALAVRDLGDHVEGDAEALVAVPGWSFPEYLAVACGLIRRYGSGEPTVADALLRLLHSCALVAAPRYDRLAAIAREAQLVLADTEREVAQSADLAPVYARADAVRKALAARTPTA